MFEFKPAGTRVKTVSNGTRGAVITMFNEGIIRMRGTIDVLRAVINVKRPMPALITPGNEVFHKNAAGRPGVLEGYRLVLKGLKKDITLKRSMLALLRLIIVLKRLSIAPERLIIKCRINSIDLKRQMSVLLKEVIGVKPGVQPCMPLILAGHKENMTTKHGMHKRFWGIKVLLALMFDHRRAMPGLFMANTVAMP